MAKSIRIGHLTDVHLGPIAGFSPRYWNIKRATGFVNWIKNRRTAYSRAVLQRLVADLGRQSLDHIVVSGDLVNIGLPAEIAAARLWLQGVGPPHHVSAVPGNHDIYSGIAHDPGVARWADYMTGDGGDARTFDSRSGFPFLRQVGGGLALVGVNSAIETAPFVARGRVGAAQLGKLDRLLRELGAKGLFRLVVIHHPPLPGQAPRRRALSDAAEFAAMLSDAGAELVIHGHNHTNSRVDLVRRDGGRAVVIGAPSGSLAVPIHDEPLARYNVYEIAGGSLCWRIEVVGRGLKSADGDIAELERYSVTAGVCGAGVGS
jgi:3',5'-cyclic AMP phosphodiesterase CpdA